MFQYYQFVFFIVGGKFGYQDYMVCWDLVGGNVVGGFGDIDGGFQIVIYGEQFFDWVNDIDFMFMGFQQICYDGDGEFFVVVDQCGIDVVWVLIQQVDVVQNMFNLSKFLFYEGF